MTILNLIKQNCTKGKNFKMSSDMPLDLIFGLKTEDFDLASKTVWQKHYFVKRTPPDIVS